MKSGDEMMEDVGEMRDQSPGYDTHLEQVCHIEGPHQYVCHSAPLLGGDARERAK